eukprot:ANDGO_02674.mRNA.1 hypothetical protein SARC_02969
MPFMLNPQMPSDGTDRDTYIRNKFGSDLSAWKKIESRLIDAGKAAGVMFNFCPRIPSTVRAHQLSEYVLRNHSISKQNELQERLFQAYFGRGEDISTEDVLVKCGAEIGISADAVLAALADDGLKVHVFELDKMSKMRYRVSGVPSFVFNEKYMLSGAQPERVFLSVFEQIEDDQ